MFGRQPKERLIDMLRGREREEDGLPDIGAVEEPADQEPNIYSLALKKRRNESLIKKMLTEGGYGDLAKSVAVRRQRLEEPQ